MPRKTRLVKNYSDILAAGTFGIVGLGATNTVGTAVGAGVPGVASLAGTFGSAMSIGAVGMPLMTAGNLMTQMDAMGRMAEPRRRRRR